MRKRWHILIDIITTNGFKNMVEVGVAHGRNAREILKAIQDWNFLYWGIDPYEMYGDYRGDNNSRGRKILHNEKMAQKYVFSDNRAELIKEFSEKAAKLFDFNSLDLVFIDGNHSYEYVKKDLESWYSKVRPMGILAGHDYIFEGRHSGVKRAVDEFVIKNCIKLHLDDDNVWWFTKE